MASLSLKVLGAMGLASYVAAYLAVRLRHVSYNRYKIVAVPAAGLPKMPRGFTFQMLGPVELARYAIDVGPEIQARRIADGLQCLAVFDRSGDLAGVAWVGRRAYEEAHLRVRFVLPANAAWDTGLWVPEDKRMGRAFSAVWAAVKIWLHREGLDWTMSTIADYNIPSILAHRRLGAIDLDHILAVRVGRLQIALGARPLMSWAGRSAMPTARPRVRAEADQALSHSTWSAVRPESR
jgi:hypothetical protein